MQLMGGDTFSAVHRPGKVFELNKVGNHYLLIVIDKVNKSIFAFPLPTKEAFGGTKTLLDVVHTSGLPVPLRNDPEIRFTAEVVGLLIFA